MCLIRERREKKEEEALIAYMVLERKCAGVSKREVEKENKEVHCRT